MKLEIKDLAPYLPYKLKVLDIVTDKKKVMNLGQGASTNWIGIKTILSYHDSGSFIYKPILRPLTDLTEEQYAELDLNHNFSIVRFSDLEKDPTRYPYTIVQKLIEWHFDVFGLIDKGLAIDINTLK